MNCEDFNNIINELADYKPLAVSTRDASVSHVALCADCAAKLANARAISATLLLAAGAESEAAPARIKADLLTAFASQQQPLSVTDHVVPFPSRRKLGWWAAAAVAAAAVVVFALMPPIWKGAPSPVPESQIAQKAPSPATPIVTPTPTAAVAPSIGQPAPKPVKAAGKRPVLRQRSPRVISEAANETVARNTANEFVPLTYLATATAIDTGTIVRVQLSRSALVRLGLPINIESSSETVKAEVVMGDDGVARAIRLVQ
ncbi:MAG TPA: hypothetical protein VGO56_07475 [Pyrinomonadaceae bacterium]|jgi:hypothetical protein|nr:hypothetical protein [Pyrinomonadaceae bacterium]